MLAVVCMKWGTPFPPDYVNVLYGGVKQNISEPFRFICFTDDPNGLRPEIEVKQIPDMGIPPERWRYGCWPKLGVFKPGAVEGATQMLYLDLDLLVMRSIDPLLERARRIGGIHILREFNYGFWQFLPISLRPDRGVQGSCFTWKPADGHRVYHAFMADKDSIMMRCDLDQDFLTEVLTERHYLPVEWFVSFKRDLVKRWPLNRIFTRIKKPDDARIVVFHGTPRPHQVAAEGNQRWGTPSKFGFGPVPWVRDYWQAALRA